jgi:LacI family transcriptional regulator
MEKTKKVTIQDVARYANVSVGTIDRVIHNRGKVSAEKKQKIEEAIKKLNFNPNLLARTLALGKHFVICSLVPEAPYPGHYWSIPKIGIEHAESMYKDFGVMVDSHFYNLFDEQSFIEKAKRILEIKPDGVILAPLFLQESRAFIKKLNEKEIPYVFIDSDLPEQESLCYIGPDVKRSAFIAARLLHSLVPENEDVLMLNMVKGLENAAALKRMENGFREFYKQKGLDESRIYSLTINSTSREIVFRELTKFYIGHPNIKGVFVTNSKAHLAADFHKIHELNIKVIGYDLVEENIQYLKSGEIDYLISQSPMQQGIKAVQTLFDLFVYKNDPPKVRHVPLDIIVRENVDFYINFQK